MAAKPGDARRPTGRPGERAVSFVLPSLFAALALWKLVPLAEGLVRARDLPRWDMAKYGLAGLQLSDALHRLDLVELVARISAMSSWPPFFPILQVPAFLVFGPEYAVPRSVVLGLYFATLLAAFWAGTGIDPRRGAVVGLALACCLLASPFFHTFAGLVMLEVPGALLWLLAIGAYGRALGATSVPLGSEGELRLWKLTAVAGLGLFFCKFNYGLLWLIPLGAHELYRRLGSWPAVVRALWRVPPLLGLGPVAVTGVALWVVALAWIRFTGGFDFELLGARLRATSIGNPVYFSFLLLLGTALWRRKAWRRSWKRLDAVLDPAARCLLLWTAVPIGLWMLVPPHMKDFFGFVENRSSGFGFWSWDGWSFYPEVLVQELAPNPVLGLGLLGLGCLPWLAWRRLPPGPRMVSLSVLTTAAALQLHPYKLSRFVTSLALPLWLAACWLGIWSLDQLWRRVGIQRPGAALTAAALLGLAAVAPEPVASLEERPRYTVSEEVRPVLDALARAGADGDEALVLGTWNLLSPALVEWHVRQMRVTAGGESLPRVWQESRRARREALRRLRSFREVVVIEALPSLGAALAEEHARENAWLQPVHNELRDAGLFAEVGLEVFPRAGYRLRWFQRSESSGDGASSGASSPLSSSSRSAES